MYGPSYNYLFQNEWCEVSILPVVRERAEVPLFTMNESPCQVSELWVNQLTNDWRVLSGIDTGAQGWGQQSGRTSGSGRHHVVMSCYVDLAQRPSTENTPKVKSGIDLAFEVLFINWTFFLKERGFYAYPKYFTKGNCLKVITNLK